ncbi:MAG: hypothetical protein ACXW2Y_11675, partial [Acidimicrobiia bacterium]
MRPGSSVVTEEAVALTPGFVDLQTNGVPLEKEAAQWNVLRQEWERFSAAPPADVSGWEELWRQVHWLR